MVNIYNDFNINTKTIKKQRIILATIIFISLIIILFLVVYRENVGIKLSLYLSIAITAIIGCFSLWFIENFIQYYQRIYNFVSLVKNSKKETVIASYIDTSISIFTYNKVKCNLLNVRIENDIRSLYIPIFLGSINFKENLKYKFLLGNNTIIEYEEL